MVAVGEGRYYELGTPISFTQALLGQYRKPQWGVPAEILLPNAMSINTMSHILHQPLLPLCPLS